MFYVLCGCKNLSISTWIKVDIENRKIKKQTSRKKYTFVLCLDAREGGEGFYLPFLFALWLEARTTLCGSKIYRTARTQNTGDDSGVR